MTHLSPQTVNNSMDNPGPFHKTVINTGTYGSLIDSLPGAIEHQVAQTLGRSFVPAPPSRPAPVSQPRRRRAIVSESVRKYGPIIEALRAQGLKYSAIGTQLNMLPSSAGSLLTKYRQAKQKGLL